LSEPGLFIFVGPAYLATIQRRTKLKAYTLAAAALLALACSAQSSSAHTWYVGDVLGKKCELSQLTPEEYASFKGTGPISADKVLKYPDGSIQVNVYANPQDFTKDPIQRWFFTSMKLCREIIEDKPEEANRDDIN
jgi:hypothetical protein